MEMLKRLMVEEEGQTMTEYALLIALIALGLVTVVTTFKGALGSVFGKMTTTVSGVEVQQQTP